MAEPTAPATTDKTTPATPTDQQAGQGTKTAAAEAYKPGTAQPTVQPNGETLGATEVTADDGIYQDGNGIASELSLLRDRSTALMKYASDSLGDRFRSAMFQTSEPLALGFEKSLPPVGRLSDALNGAEVPSESTDANGNRRSVETVPEGGEPPGGVVITDTSTLSDGQSGVQTITTYDADGNIVSTTTKHTDAENNNLGTETTTYTTNADGQIVGSSTTIIGGNGEAIGRYDSTYQYNSAGQMSMQTTQRFDENGNPLGSEATAWGYDESGNLIGSHYTEYGTDNVAYHTESTTYQNGYVTEFSTSDVEADGNTYVSTFKPAEDGSGNIVRVDEVWDTAARNNTNGWASMAGSDQGLQSRSTTTSRPDGSTTQVFEIADPATGNIVTTQTTEIRTDGSVLMTSNGGEGGRLISSELPPGTVQSFSDTGSLSDGTRNLFEFGDGNISVGVVQVEQIGNSADGQQQPGSNAFERGLAVMKGMATDAENPDANLKSVISAFGEFGREADDPRNKRPDATNGVEKFLEIGEDAKKTVTDLVSAGATLRFTGDGSPLTGMYNTQHVIGEGSTNTAIARAREDGTDGTIQGGLKEYGRYGPTFAEALAQINRADSSSNSFGADRLAIISLDDPGGKPGFAGATDNVEAADDTPGDKSLKSGMDNLLAHGNGSLYTAGDYLRGSSESGTVREGIANTRYASDDGSFASGSTNMKDAGGDPITGDPRIGYQNFKKLSDDGTFKDGVNNAKLASDDGHVSSGIRALEALSPTRNIVEGGDIVKLAGGSSFDQGATNIRALSSDGTFSGGSKQLGILGGGDYHQGAENLVTIGNGNPTAGVANLKEIGGGSAEKGIQTFADIGNGDANRGVQVARELGNENVMNGYHALQTLGNGDAVAGSRVLTEIGHGDPVAGAKALAEMGNGDAAAGAKALAQIGNGDAQAGLRTANQAGGGDPIIGARNISTLGNGDTTIGASTFAKLGNGDGAAGAQALKEIGHGDTTVGAKALAQLGGGDAMVAVRVLNELGKGDTAAGARVVNQIGGDPVVVARVLLQAGNGDLVAGAKAVTLAGGGDAAAGIRTLMFNRSSSEGAVGALLDKLGNSTRAVGDAPVSVNVTIAGGGVRANGSGGIGEVTFSKAAADTTKLLQGHISAHGAMGLGDGARPIFSGSTTIRSTFTYRGVGGAEISVIRMADGRILVITHRPGGRSIGFTTDGATISAGIALSRRPLVKGALGETPEKKKILIARKWRKFKKRKLIGVEIALALLLTSAAIARANDREEEDEAKDTHLAYQKQAFAILTRPTWLVRPNEDLVKLAQHLFQDGRLGFLIADLNATQIKECIIEGKRVVELKERQKIELPVWQDIVEFRRQHINNVREEDLITVVTENSIDAELINATLAPVMGVAVVKPARTGVPAKLPAFARKLGEAAAANAPQPVSSDAPTWTLSEGKDPERIAMARRSVTKRMF